MAGGQTINAVDTAIIRLIHREVRTGEIRTARGHAVFINHHQTNALLDHRLAFDVSYASGDHSTSGQFEIDSLNDFTGRQIDLPSRLSGISHNRKNVHGSDRCYGDLSSRQSGN